MSTYVLVHGAYQGGWIWKLVGQRLEAAGHTVYRPSLDGCADRAGSLRAGISTESHGQDVADFLVSEDIADVHLVGTSSGGMVICRAAELASDRVARVVFVDALALRDGERIADFVDRPAGITTDLATGPSREDAQARLFSDLEDDLRTWALDRVSLHPLGPMVEPVHLSDFWDRDWDAQVIYCTRSTNPPRPHQERTAEALGASWAELETGHYPMLSTPDELAALLMD